MKGDESEHYDGGSKSADRVALAKSFRKKKKKNVRKNNAGRVLPPEDGKKEAVSEDRTPRSSSEDPEDARNTWQRTPYTRKTSAGSSPDLSSAKGSTYSIEFRKPGRGGSGRSIGAEGNRVGALSPEGVDAASAFTPRQLPIPHPPVGHHGDLCGVTPRRFLAGIGRRSGSDSAAAEAGFREEEITLLDENTAFGGAYAALGFNEAESLGNAETKKQASNALKLADRLVSVPLSRIWHVFSELVVNLMLLMNVAVAAADIYLGPVYLYYKVTAFVLGLAENLVAVALWAVGRHPRFRDSDERRRLERYQQYVENVLGETLIYPLLALSVLGFTSDKMYESGSAFLYVQVALLACDLATMLYNGVLRMHMLRRLMNDLKPVLRGGGDAAAADGDTWKMAGFILPRCYWTVIGNVVVTLALAVMFGLQTNRDNYSSSDYRLTTSSALLMVLLIVLPTASLALFFVGNLYWIMEILMKINIGIASNVEFQEKLREQYGDTMSDALQYSRSKIPVSEKKLAAIQSASGVRKMLYCLYEIQFVAVTFLWQLFLFVVVHFFDGFDEARFNWMTKAAFLALFAVANPHLTLVMLLNNFMVLALVLGTILYPLFLPFCCKTKAQGKYSEFTSKEDA